ncbi:DinB family protein [Roseateles oligotrophus]|uniref:DinB family protein n=1 Tax=Roseateles oligotrophus TaxID=1769250 RepID=A0ABT2YMA7_9BURK|nr:DinB family protein [Roseateles oligotrophus]MCV2371056.1 DinB family protein [Roseateles oligotrophus]
MLIEAFKYKQWADRRTLDAVAGINTSEFPAAMAFALQQLNHMVRVEELFRARLAGEAAAHPSTNTETVPALDELEQRLAASNQWLARYVENLTQQEREQALSFQFVDGQYGRMTRLEMLFHLVNHGTYHRGAIGHALDLANAARPADTYTVFIHALEPARREPD